jgi:hypothetical protein
MESTDGAEGATPVRRLAEMSRSLRESVASILEEREKLQSDRAKLVAGFTSFALDGDLEAALTTMSLVDAIKSPLQTTLHDEWEVATEDAWYLCQRVEKSAIKLLKSTDGDTADELDHLRKTVKMLKKDLQLKETEVEQLRAQFR